MVILTTNLSKKYRTRCLLKNCPSLNTQEASAPLLSYNDEPIMAFIYIYLIYTSVFIFYLSVPILTFISNYPKSSL